MSKKKLQMLRNNDYATIAGKQPTSIASNYMLTMRIDTFVTTYKILNIFETFSIHIYMYIFFILYIFYMYICIFLLLTFIYLIAEYLPIDRHDARFIIGALYFKLGYQIGCYRNIWAVSNEAFYFTFKIV